MQFTPFRGPDVRVVFMGTPEFAVPTLAMFLRHAAPGHLWPGGLDLVGVFTRMDRPSGRGQQVAYSPIKQYALANSLDVYQPGSLRQPEAQSLLRRLAPDLIVVAAFGQILPPEVIRMPHYGCLNVHASLLPRHRGASPIAAAILAGDTQTGVTLMQMDEGLDTGPILARRATPIEPEENAGELSARLAELGAALLHDTLAAWLAHGIKPEPQDDTQATMTHLLQKSDGRIDWHMPAEHISRQVRAYTPWPGAFTTWEGKQIKILRAHPIAAPEGLTPGTCFVVGQGSAKGTLACAAEQGALALEVIQLEGKRALPSAAVLRGHPALASARLGA